MRIVSLPRSVAGLVLSCAPFVAPPVASAQVRDAGKLFAESCASCHGPTLAGGSAPSMLDDEWTHGGTDTDLTRLITDGSVEKGMPAWGAALTAGEIRSLVVYIREQRAGYGRRRETLPAPPSDHTFTTAFHNFRVETVVRDVQTPWSINWLPDGTMIFTEKTGKLRLFQNGKLLPAIKGTPAVDSGGQGGLLEVAPHPDYAQNGWIYLTFSDPQENAEGKAVAMTKLVRGRIRDGRWIDEQTLFAADVELYRPAGGVHFGSRIAFDTSGHIFFTIGERGSGPNAQELFRPNGKVHRLYDDGRVPADNPFVHTPGALPSIWSYGHRNPQGLDFDPTTGVLWETEHGPRGGDELNIIQPGLNYGWPEVTYGMNYNGTPITGDTTRPDVADPIAHWTPSIAVCGIDFYTGNRFPKWTGNLLVTALAQQHVRRVVIKDGQVVEQEILLQDFGRCRDVATGPDGYIYVALNQPDLIVRFVPID